jgi:hypothetical protein
LFLVATDLEIVAPRLIANGRVFDDLDELATELFAV